MIYNGEEVCDICLTGDCNSDNQIVFCDVCDCSVHQACYSVRDEELAADCWLCQACAQRFEGPCFLCGLPLRGYSSKEYVIQDRPAATRFVHCLCFRIFPSLVYCPNERTIQVSAIIHLRLEAMRLRHKKRTCLYCNYRRIKSDGIVILCRALTGCTETYHPLCMVLAGGGVWEEGFDTYDVIHALCPRHVGCNWAAIKQNRETSGVFEDAMMEVQTLLLDPITHRASSATEPAGTYKIGDHVVTTYDDTCDNHFVVAGTCDGPHLEVDSTYPFSITSTQGKVSEPYSLSIHETALLRHMQITARLTRACSRCIKTERDLRLISDNALSDAFDRQFGSCTSLEDLIAQSLASLKLASLSAFSSLCLIPGMCFWRTLALASNAMTNLFSGTHEQTAMAEPWSPLHSVPCLELFLTALQHTVVVFFLNGDASDAAASVLILRPPLAISSRSAAPRIKFQR